MTIFFNSWIGLASAFVLRMATNSMDRLNWFHSFVNSSFMKSNGFGNRLNNTKRIKCHLFVFCMILKWGLKTKRARNQKPYFIVLTRSEGRSLIYELYVLVQLLKKNQLFYSKSLWIIRNHSQISPIADVIWIEIHSSRTKLSKHLNAKHLEQTTNCRNCLLNIGVRVNLV